MIDEQKQSQVLEQPAHCSPRHTVTPIPRTQGAQIEKGKTGFRIIC
jgi:hypothetical protein